MFFDIDEHSGNFDSLLDMFQSFVPKSRIELYRPRDSFNWRGKLDAADGLSLLRLQCDGDWNF